MIIYMYSTECLTYYQAASDIDTVNRLWKGLGYYSRAARLLSGAKKVVEELHGHLPMNAKEMQSSIPGIGRYTAGAICSIAYNEQVPVVRLFSFLCYYPIGRILLSLDIAGRKRRAVTEPPACLTRASQVEGYS
jgi:endonuclease III-like uncharacterized protein